MTPRPILPADPKAHYERQREAILTAMRRVLEGGTYILGPEVAAFEAAFAAYLEAGEVIGVGSGTDAIELALRVAGIGAGDAVLTVSHTAVATVAAIELTGATPVFVDIDPLTYTMDPAALAATIAAHHGKPLRAVVPVHLYGQPADMLSILAIAEQHQLVVIEDCAQAHGATIGSQKVGTFGALAAFSFYPTKNLGALGDGGALVCNTAALAARARLLQQYGWRERYISEIPGLNTRLDALQAAILGVKLPQLDADNTVRRQIAARYSTELAATGLTLPAAAPGTMHVYHQYTVLAPERRALVEALRADGVLAGILYPVPVHLQPAYLHRLTGGAPLPVTERVCQTLLCLPVQPTLDEAAVTTVIAAVRRHLAAR